jgi:hypothetical protein
MNTEELAQDEAVAMVAATARRLFPIVSERRAREVALLVLRDLAAHGVRLVRDQEAR